ncbi:hypothetical protein FC17_GL001840 [Secundilactobacillus paracollinoides DSM 15502 = JCM 11969]|nr:hypothetical protein FC17_GL001840 [Secundilactobacillus paracollinoides DSM 15502 = JCM 11969]
MGASTLKRATGGDGMPLLISDTSELQDATRLAETQIYLRATGYDLQPVDDQHFLIANSVTSLQVRVPVLLTRYDREQFLSVHADGETTTLPYIKKTPLRQ